MKSLDGVMRDFFPTEAIFRLRATSHDPAIGTWFKEHPGELGALARKYFFRMRECGGDVREVLHDGCPVACVGNAAFAYVNVFKAHASVGFFLGAVLEDSDGILEGSGKRMRHVKIRPGSRPDSPALNKLIDAAYKDMKERMRQAGGNAVE